MPFLMYPETPFRCIPKLRFGVSRNSVSVYPETLFRCIPKLCFGTEERAKLEFRPTFYRTTTKRSVFIAIPA